VAFVGLGKMGEPMAARLVNAGWSVVGYDVADAVREHAASVGIRSAGSLVEAVNGADVVVLMLPDSNAVEHVLSDELLDQVAAGSLLIDMSSSEPLRTQAIAHRASARQLRMLDAPVSGGVKGAVHGTLTIMVGGPEGDLSDARPLLEVLGRVVHAGPVGAGHAVKALNNLMSATHLLVTSEAMLAGERFGLQPETLLAIFNTSSGRSGSTENKWPNFILPGTFDSGFGLRLMLKDMRIGVELAEKSGVPCSLGREAVDLWSDAAAELPADADHTEIARWLGSRLGERAG
jgi:3-hydroxyisobutyrate dehydrogenase